ncbi:MAG: GDSL-type esterase/lipase family protein [Ruthenibacterium sp.]
MQYDNIAERRILIFGDSNTFGYDPAHDGRYGETERYPRRLQALLGAQYAVLEEGLCGRTAVFDDPLTEGLSGLAMLAPLMLSHAPLDTLVIMLGTNDTKERFGCNAHMIATGFARLLDKALGTPAWRGAPDILLVAPSPVVPAYRTLMFCDEMGVGCAEKSAALAGELALVAAAKGIRFLDAGDIPGVGVHPLDGMHLTREAHAALADALAAALRAPVEK